MTTNVFLDTRGSLILPSLTLPHSHQYAKSNQENIVKNVSGESYLEQHGMQGPRSTPIASLGQW